MSTTDLDLAAAIAAIKHAPVADAAGRVRSVVGLAIAAQLPLAKLGGLVKIQRSSGEPLLAQVVGFRDGAATLLPFSDAAGLGENDPIYTLEQPLSVQLGPDLLGRVLDGLGTPCDGGPDLRGPAGAIQASSPDPLSRPAIDEPLPLGIRAIDGLCTLGKGQRIGLFSGAGLGKSALLRAAAQHAQADVIVVCLVGERGREIAEFQAALPAGTRARTVMVCAPSDAPAMARMTAAHTATRIAEFFSDRGQQVLLMVDSLTRHARAARDVALAAGELPARRGYPASVFSGLPRLLERAGTRPGPAAAITALYAVLVEADDLDEPIADELRGLLDGHIVLSRDLANRGHFPAVDAVRSLSRLMGAVTTAQQRAAAGAVRQVLAMYDDNRDLIELGAYRSGHNPRLDRALERLEPIQAFLRQAHEETTAFDDTLQRLQAVAGEGPEPTASCARPPA